MVFMRMFRETDPLKSQSINNFCGIDISQPTPSVSLSVSLFSLEEIEKLKVELPWNFKHQPRQYGGMYPTFLFFKN